MSDSPPKTVAMVHVGRALLGFELRGVKRAKPNGNQFSLEDGEFARRYESTLTAARSGPDSERRQAFGSFGALARHSSRYVRGVMAADRAAEASACIAELAP